MNAVGLPAMSPAFCREGPLSFFNCGFLGLLFCLDTSFFRLNSAKLGKTFLGSSANTVLGILVLILDAVCIGDALLSGHECTLATRGRTGRFPRGLVVLT